VSCGFVTPVHRVTQTAVPPALRPLRIGEHPRTSRIVHRLDALATLPTIAIASALFVVAGWIVILVSGLDAKVQFVFGNLCASVTLVMVFVLQHTQRREQLALQLKLDEIVHALPEADERLVAVEASPDDEILGLEERRIGHYVAAREGSKPGAADD